MTAPALSDPGLDSLATAPRYPAGTLPGISIYTLGKLGMNLPIGLRTSAGVRERLLEFYDYDFDKEMEIANVLDDEDVSVIDQVDHILAIMLKKVGSFDLQPLKVEERRMWIAGMYTADVLHAWVVLRRMSLGRELATRIICPRKKKCQYADPKTPFDYIGDLDSLDVYALDEPAPIDIAWRVGVLGSFAYQSRKMEGFWIEPGRWTSMKAMQGKDGAERSMELMRSTIVDVDPRPHDGPASFRLPAESLGKLDGLDVINIQKSLTENDLGPNLIFDLNCPGCKTRILETVDWKYSSFFRLAAKKRGVRRT